MKTAEYWLKKLNLEKHPEGGWFKEVYKSGETLKKEHLHERYSGERHTGTSIYFLITDREFSAFHRIKSDEIWHFYESSAVTIHMINAEGIYSSVKLGNNFEAGEVFQFTIPHGTWFAAEVEDTDSFALIGCTVSPGFDYDDFELGEREEMMKLFPMQGELIKKLTRD